MKNPPNEGGSQTFTKPNGQIIKWYTTHGWNQLHITADCNHMKEAENEQAPELDRKKIPRWDSRCHRGIYLGRSPNHADNVALVLNLTTGHITAQFHAIFDDNFETINSTMKDLENSFPRLFSQSCPNSYIGQPDEDESNNMTDPEPNADHFVATSDHKRENTTKSLAEVCKNADEKSKTFSRIGWMVNSMLPPLVPRLGISDILRLFPNPLLPRSLRRDGWCIHEYVGVVLKLTFFLFYSFNATEGQDGLSFGYLLT